MTTRIAIWLALLIAAFVALDLWFGWGAGLNLVQRGIGVIHRVAFWR